MLNRIRMLIQARAAISSVAATLTSRLLRLGVALVFASTAVFFSGECLMAQTKKKPAAAPRKRDADSDEESAPPASAKKSRKKKEQDKNSVEGVADYASTHFVLHTDLADEAAEELLDRLETMLNLISKYWGRPPSGIIEMFVVKDLSKWPRGAFPADGLASIRGGAGVTISRKITQGDAFVAKSTVYAVADRGTPQHEAVHAYCGQTFGRTGPVWYSEGMAEMGQYWRKDDASVSAEPYVIGYLRQSEPKSLNEIVNGEEWSGDSWENYAWRWALCHLLANNTNYASRFRPLGLGLLMNQDVSFEQTYGDMAKEISFEYRQFLKHLEPGHRVDLCSWDWKAKFKLVKSANISTAKVEAGRGWQASRLILIKGEEYEYSASGTWSMSKNTPAVDADGEADGTGKLVGAVLTDANGDYALGEPFELGKFGSFAAPEDGNLYLRCQDGWAELADNRGSLTVKLKLKDKGAPLAPPKSEDDKKKPNEKKPGEKKEPDEKKEAAE